MPREEWANRGPHGACPEGWKAQGKKVDPSAVAAQAIEAEPSFGQIKPWRGPSGPRIAQHSREKIWRTSIAAHKRPGFPGVEIETLVERKDCATTQRSVRMATLLRHRISVGPQVMGVPSVPTRAIAFQIIRTGRHRNDIQPADEEVPAYPSVAAPASGRA